MNEQLRKYILAEANSDWVSELLETKADEGNLCDFVERMVKDALYFRVVADLYRD